MVAWILYSCAPLCRVRDRRTDVLTLKPRIRVHEIVFGRAFADLAHQELDGNPSLRMTGFPSITRGLISMREDGKSAKPAPSLPSQAALSDLARS
jgi:hypothetical protein